MSCYTTENNRDDFAGRLAKLRCERGVTQEDLAFLLQKSRQMVTKWENRAARPTIDDLVSIADFFGVTTDYLLLGVKSENVEIHRTLGISDAAISVLHSFAKEKPFMIPALDKALSSREFIEVLSSILSVEGERGYYDGCSHSHGEPFYACTLSPDSYAAYLSARLTLILDALRKENGVALKPYPPAEAKEAEFIKEAKRKGILID